MNNTHRGYRALIVCCCLSLWLAASTSYAAIDAMPVSEFGPPPPAAPAVDQLDGYDRLLQQLLTPQAEIRIGPGNADTDALMRRSQKPSLSYVVRSLWNGIVEYVFPEHGLFRRGATLARIYDPALLSDLERAREYAATADVSPLTIATTPRHRSTEELPSAGDAAVVEPPQISQPPAVAAPTLPATPEPELPEIVQIDFDFEANQRRQDQLREQAEFAGAAIAAGIDNTRATQKALDEARAELEERKILLEQGVLAAQALAPAEERVATTRAAHERAAAELAEVQVGYERLSGRIQRLEREAAEAHDAIRLAREERARRAEQIAQRQRDQARARQAPQPAQRPTPQPPQVAQTPVDEPEPERPAMAIEEAAGPVTAITREMRELAAPRWDELDADAPGVVSDVLAPQGTHVQAGDELLRVANLQLAQVAARVGPAQRDKFRVGRSVTLTFEDYPEVIFEGWISSLTPCAITDEVEVGLLLVCNSGRFADDPYLALRWMTLEAGVGAETVRSQTLDPVMQPARNIETDLRLLQMFPAIGPRSLYIKRVSMDQVPSDDHYIGRLRLLPVERVAVENLGEDDNSMRLAALADWRRTYVEGMTTSILDDGTCVTYPAEGNVSTAIRAMLRGQVNHRPNLCAATMREALGWGLGDAHRWATQLPRMGYVAREDRLPRPGDILVWPFTFGPNRSQHIGFAVRQGRHLMMLSNLSGHLGTSEILDGYIAFYRPEDAVAP